MASDSTLDIIPSKLIIIFAPLFSLCNKYCPYSRNSLRSSLVPQHPPRMVHGSPKELRQRHMPLLPISYHTFEKLQSYLPFLIRSSVCLSFAECLISLKSAGRSCISIMCERLFYFSQCTDIRLKMSLFIMWALSAGVSDQNHQSGKSSTGQDGGAACCDGRNASFVTYALL